MLETSFRIHRDEVIRTLIGSPPTAERQKVGFDSIATERQSRRNGRWKRQRRNGIFHVSNVILTALTYNSYGIYVTATAKRQRQNGNGIVETRHNANYTVSGKKRPHKQRNANVTSHPAQV